MYLGFAIRRIYSLCVLYFYHGQVPLHFLYPSTICFAVHVSCIFTLTCGDRAPSVAISMIDDRDPSTESDSGGIEPTYILHQ